MGKEWDGFGDNQKFQEFNRLWSIECLRVLKSGGFMFAMGGTRTHHRLTCGIEDAGFLIRDEIEHCYASGFPKAQQLKFKAQNIEKMIDKYINFNDDKMIWKMNSETANLVEMLSLKKLIEVGGPTIEHDFVASSVLDFYIEKDKNINVKIVELPYGEPQQRLRKMFIAPMLVKLPIEQLLSHVATAEIRFNDQNANSYIRIIFVRIDARVFSCEKTFKTKEEEARKIENGKSPSLSVMDIDALFVEQIERLKRIILNELKITPNLDTTSKMELLSATDVIITASIKAHLISSMAAMLETQLNENCEGYKTAQLKPSHEPIVIAQKPCEGSTTDNVMKYGVGGYNVDATRIPYQNEKDLDGAKIGFDKDDDSEYEGVWKKIDLQADTKGRFPPNLLVQDDVLNDDKNEVDISFSRYFSLDAWWAERIKHLPRDVQKVYPFLIVPKAAKGEKNEGIEDESTRECRWNNAGEWKNIETKYKNIHPTCKPVSLMSYLITLSTREKAVVLDPFMGSGTTGIAAHCLGRDFIGIEKNEEYMKIAQARIAEAEKQTRLVF